MEYGPRETGSEGSVARRKQNPQGVDLAQSDVCLSLKVAGNSNGRKRDSGKWNPQE